MKRNLEIKIRRCYFSSRLKISLSLGAAVKLAETWTRAQIGRFAKQMPRAFTIGGALITLSELERVRLEDYFQAIWYNLCKSEILT